MALLLFFQPISSVCYFYVLCSNMRWDKLRLCYSGFIIMITRYKNLITEGYFTWRTSDFCFRPFAMPLLLCCTVPVRQVTHADSTPLEQYDEMLSESKVIFPWVLFQAEQLCHYHMTKTVCFCFFSISVAERPKR